MQEMWEKEEVASLETLNRYNNSSKQQGGCKEIEMLHALNLILGNSLWRLYKNCTSDTRYLEDLETRN